MPALAATLELLPLLVAAATGSTVVLAAALIAAARAVRAATRRRRRGGMIDLTGVRPVGEQEIEFEWPRTPRGGR